MSSPIVIERILDAPRERVFSAWTRPELMSRWFFAAPGWTVHVEADVRVGGFYRVEMRDGEGGVHEQHGEYKVIEPVSKLVFTWSCPNLSVEGSLVTINLEAIGEKTRLLLRHAQLPDDGQVRKAHEDGWMGCLANLETYLQVE